MSDWNHYFLSLRKYLDFFRAHTQVYPELKGLGGALQAISDSELAGLLSWTNFAAAISLKDPESRRQIYEERNWNCIESTVGLVASPIPLVLKGALYKFLATLAIDEIAAVNIWNCLLCEKICIFQQDGRLSGIQQDLDERESPLKIYDCSQGFLTLLNKLLTHKTRPGTQQISPYLQYIVNSILCQFSARSYNDIKQMWLLVKLALDSLYEPLKTFYVTPASVRDKVIEVQILSQLLCDSTLSRSLLQIIVEGACCNQNVSLVCHSREDANYSALRLFFTAISNREALADAVRAVNSDIMVASIESILFSPIPQYQKAGTNYLSILFQYISEEEYLIRHAFYVWLILKEATSQRPSLQPRIIQSLLPRRAQLIASTASLSIFSSQDISISIKDLSPTDLETLSNDRVKGELCRLIFEVFNDSMESNPDTPNIAYALMNFDLNDIQSSSLHILYSKGHGLTFLQNMLEIIIQLTLSGNPFKHKFSGLYESALRLLLRMCLVRAASSVPMLRLLRSQYDLIFRLASSKVFCCMDTQKIKTNDTLYLNETKLMLSWKNIDEDITYATTQKSLQAMILELIALELSLLIRLGQIEQPQKYLKLLLSTNEEATSNGEAKNALLWELLIESHVFIEPLAIPSCSKFDFQKVEELLSLCVRKNSCNIDQFDVLYLHLLLNSEINYIVNAEIDVIREEAKSLLDYCVKKNAQNLLEGACTHLLEGWLCLINILAIHVPLHFINIDVHKNLLVDALFLLRDYCSTVEMSQDLAASIARCMARVICAICNLFIMFSKDLFTRETLLPILHLALQCIVLPGYNKSIAFKLELYASCLRILDLFSNFSSKESSTSSFRKSDKTLSNNTDDLLILLPKMSDADVTLKLKNETAHDDSMLSMVREERNTNDLWMQLIEPITHEIVQTLTSDIVFAPLTLKMLSAAVLVDLLHEDCRFNGRMAKEFAFTGCLNCVNDTLIRLQSPITLKEKTLPSECKEHTGTLAIALNSLIAITKSYLKIHS